MNAVIYARYSSQGQNVQSIDGQLRICHEFAERKGLRVISEYIDKAKTGTNDNRPAFQKMLKDSENKTFQFVIVYTLDRFSRSRMDSMIHKMKLHENGVKVLSAQENISDTEEGQFFEMFLEYNAEMYSKRLSKRVKHGLDTSVNNGTFTGGHLVFGYALDSNKVVVEPKNASIVKFAFEQYAIGTSKDNIAKALNEQGHRYKGKLFKGQHLDRWLTCERYTGSFIFGGRECNNTYPQIIDKKIFETVRQRLVANKRMSGAESAKEPYLLQGKAFCGHCGEPMVADSGVGKLGTMYRYYVCRNNKKKRVKCDKRAEKKHFLEMYATERVVTYLSDSELVQEFAQRMVTWYDDKTGQTALKGIKNQMQAINKQVDVVVDNLLETPKDEKLARERISQKIKDLGLQLEDLQKQHDDLESMAGMKLKVEHIVEFINRYIKGSITDTAFQERIIKNLVNCIYIYDDKFVIYFNLTNRKEEIYIGLDETEEIADNVLEQECSNMVTVAPPITNN